MKRIAFCLPDDGSWTGGVNYLETVCYALLAHPELDYEPIVFCNPGADVQLQARFAQLLGSRLVPDPLMAGGRRAGLAGALLFGCNAAMSKLCTRNRCAVVMEAADFFGYRFPIACLAWVPDFQDRHLPQLFSPWWRMRRSLGIRLQLAAGRTVLLSSEDARADCERFYPNSKTRTAVARFAVRPALAPEETDSCIPARYSLPERFFYLPNQYWVHKNHMRVVDALALLRSRAVSIVIASSGSPHPRHADYFSRLRAKVVGEGLTENFRFLGSVPTRDVAILMRCSVAMLNPSLFEGWSTTVEEAKALGVPMVLSNIAVHREQTGGHAEFFDPYDPVAIATTLERVWSAHRGAPTLAAQRAAAADAVTRIAEFAVQFTRACEQALVSARTPST